MSQNLKPAMITNPVLPGFNPDPSMIRVGEDFYIVTSTFEWFPGVPIYHSRDLVNWEMIGHVLTRKSQLNLTRIGDSAGIYAPMLSYHNNQFYVIYTVVSRSGGWPLSYYPNYVVTADNIAGPWSDPIHVDSLGFDPSFFGMIMARPMWFTVNSIIATDNPRLRESVFMKSIRKHWNRSVFRN